MQNSVLDTDGQEEIKENYQSTGVERAQEIPALSLRGFGYIMQPLWTSNDFFVK